jgi:stearoyl-CoA desaturase (delta-9 desaturase)
MTEEIPAALNLGEARLTKPKPKWSTGIALGLIHLGACAAFLPMFFSWQAVLVAFVLYYLTGGVGITFCFHRLLTHRSLVVPKWLEYGTAIVGTLALQGGPIDWVATHRAHHAYSDTERDPHNARRGFWWSHVLWLFAPNPARLTPAEEVRFAPDLAKDPFYRVLDKIPLLLQIALGVGLFLLGGWPFVVWGIFVRLVVTYNVTWFVNSAAHLFGYRTYDASDLSTNNWWVGLMAWGEGWHNNHHAFPFSARHGLGRKEFDMTWITIRQLELLGLAKDVKVPTPAMLTRALNRKRMSAAEDVA